VSATRSGADVRAFYAALGIELAGWAQREASVACFANPDAHARGDRDPSCSVNVISGAWRCWGCGAAGGAYDAALLRGLGARAAIDLMVEHGLTERRSRNDARGRSRSSDGGHVRHGWDSSAPVRSGPAIGERELAVAHERLKQERWPISLLRPEQRAVWSRAAVLGLGCGWERGRLLIPLRDERQRLCGVLRYAPRHDRAPKMLAAAGTRLMPVPLPAAEASPWIVLVEGPPDMISARSHGLPAIAIPGDHAWETDWARLFAGRRASVVMDCDHAGREAAKRIAGDLRATGVHGSVIDLAPGRSDGWDLTDWLAAHRDWPVARLRAALGERPRARGRR
jgi:hypothetical protein